MYAQETITNYYYKAEDQEEDEEERERERVKIHSKKVQQGGLDIYALAAEMVDLGLVVLGFGCCRWEWDTYFYIITSL